jgi:2-oxoglutarate ferredoxin oxidoreductase subunit alpha
MEKFLPYLRDENGVRPWAIPGMKGLQHRIGGIEKEDKTGNISYDPQNHETDGAPARGESAQRIADTFRPIRLDSGPEKRRPADRRLGIHVWRHPHGAVELQKEGHSVAHVHLRHLFPFNKGLRGMLKRYKRKVLVPEMNSGQLRQLMRAEYLVDAQGLNKIQGMPFTSRGDPRGRIESVEAMSTATSGPSKRRMTSSITQ